MKKLNKISAIVLTLVFMLGLAGAVKAATYVNLGNADSFAILAYSGITFSGTATVTGDIGSSPTNSITGLGGVVLNGTNHGNDATSILAQSDLATAFTSAGQSPTTALTELGSTTKLPGVYNSADGTFGMTGTLTLDAQGDPNAIFIFRTASTLITAGSSEVKLINGAQACNVFWQVGSSATLGSASVFKGNILAHTSIGVGTTANVEGRLLANTGAVTLDGTNIVAKATCVNPSSAGSGTGARYFELLPSINVTKIPSPLNLPSGPGPVTYTYSVTSLNSVPMNTVWVKDNKCAPVQFVSGDTNGNGLLDPTETWTYDCFKTVSQTETNIATTHGYANGFDVYDTANATVAVGTKLPPPLIHLVKTASVSALPVGGGAITYTYKVTNPGIAPLSDVSVSDNKCTGLPGRVVGNSGDVNNNTLLDPGETWSLTCQTNLTQTTTNIGTAEGSANGLKAIDLASVTVIVATPGLPNTGLPPGTTTAMTVGALVAVTALAAFALKRRTT